MDRNRAMARMEGCFVPMPTLFHEDLTLNLEEIRRHVRFMLDGGLKEGNAVLLISGAAGDFPCLNPAERLQVAEAVLAEADGKIGVIVGAQSTGQAETIEIARGAAELGADAVQISPPYYFHHTEGDVHDYVKAVGEAADIGLVFYPTYWTATRMSLDALDRLIDDVPNIILLKWRNEETLIYLHGITRFSDRVGITDNQLCFVSSYIMGTRGFNVHAANYWPEWGITLMELLRAGEHERAQSEIMRVLWPFYEISWAAEEVTGGESVIDKLCLELCGFASSRCRPPTRDVRDQYRDQVRRMLETVGVPHLK